MYFHHQAGLAELSRDRKALDSEISKGPLTINLGA